MRKYCFASIPEVLSVKISNYFMNNLNLNAEDLEKLSIGITVLLFNTFELSIVFIIALFLGIIKEALTFLFAFVLLRTLGAGVHCKTSGHCLILTLIFYIGSSLLAKYYPLNIGTASFTALICIALLFKYAPADTENRPIISERQRKNLKIKTVLCALSIFIISILLNNNTILTCIVCSILVETISVLPLTYRLLKTGYDNYKLYE